MSIFEPIYRQTLASGALKKKVEEAVAALSSCTLCPRECEADRTCMQSGVCATERKAIVSSAYPHFGEEAPLVGYKGSGTIFFSSCSLLCKFCQNYLLSHDRCGDEVSDEELAGLMLSLQARGCLNINFVTPTHVVPQILSAVYIAAEQGLTTPLVYNTGAYDKLETLKLLDGVIDIYMPDFKFWDSEVAANACDAPDYPEVARKAVLEMHRQVGDLVIDESGRALRGLLVRHLVLPNGLAGTREVMRFLYREVSPNTYVNIMAQYRTAGRAREIPGFKYGPSCAEFEAALQAAKEEGITRLDRG